MLTQDQVIEDAHAVVKDLLLDVQMKDLTLIDEEAILLEAAKILALSSKILVKMLNNKQKLTMH